MINFSTDMPVILAELQKYVMMDAAELPEHTRLALIDASSLISPPHRVYVTIEVLYAAKSSLSKEGRDVTARLAYLAASNGWWGMSVRGMQIAAAMQRIGGYSAPEGQEWPSAEDDPAPLREYLEPSEQLNPDMYGPAE